MAAICSTPGCGRELMPATGSRPRLYCNSSCRRRAHELRKARGEDSAGLTLVPPVEVGPVEAAVLEELQKLGRQDSVLGQSALVLARRVDSKHETAAGLVASAKQLEATLASVARAAKAAEPDFIDRLQARLAEGRAQTARRPNPQAPHRPNNWQVIPGGEE